MNLFAAAAADAAQAAPDTFSWQALAGVIVTAAGAAIWQAIEARKGRKGQEKLTSAIEKTTSPDHADLYATVGDIKVRVVNLEEFADATVVSISELRAVAVEQANDARDAEHARRMAGLADPEKGTAGPSARP